MSIHDSSSSNHRNQLPQLVFISDLGSSQVFVEMPTKEEGKPVEKTRENLKKVADDILTQLPQLPQLPEKTQGGLWGRIRNGVGYVAQGAGKAVQGVQGVLAQAVLEGLTVGAISESDKEFIIAAAKKKMREKLQDPHYVELYEWMANLLWPSIKQGILSYVGPTYQSVILSKEEVISNLLQVALAQGFANLADQVSAIRDENQSPLASLISFFVQKSNATEETGQKNYLQALASVEREYESTRKTVATLAKKFLPQLGFTERTLIKEYIQQTDEKKKKEIKASLIAKFKEKDALWIAETFFEACDRLSTRHRQLQKVFEEIADQVFVKALFPQGLQGLQLPPQFQAVLQYYSFESSIAKLIAGYLQDFYDPLVYDPSEELEKDLKKRMGQDVGQMMQAPSALALGLSKHYIESDPKKVVDLIQSNLATFLPTEVAHSQASWITGSLQEILESKNKNIESLGNFVQGIMRDLVLAITSQGAKLLVKDGEKIDQTQLIKTLTDRLVAQVSSLDLQSEIPESFWEMFTVDLPIPNFLIPSIRNFIKKKVAEWRPSFFDVQNTFGDIKKIGEASVQKIQSYKGGKDLITLVEQMSDWLVQKIVQPEANLIAQLGVNNDNIEELFRNYLPGIQIRPEFKNWFKNNVGALGIRGDQSSQSISLLKQGITLLCLVGITHAVEKNGNAESFISSLSENIRQVFTEAVNAFTTDYSSEMPNILKLQAEIKTHQLRLQKLNAQIAERKQKNENYLKYTRLTELEAGQQECIKEALHAQKRYHKALDTVEDLTESLHELKKQRQQLYREIQTQGVVEVKDQSEIEFFKTAIASTQSALQIALKEKEISQKDYDLKIEDAFQKDAFASNEPGYVRWEDRMMEVFAHLTDLEDLHVLTRTTAKLEKQLEVYLPPFQTLARKLMSFVGFDKPDQLKLPPFLIDKIWPYIESFQKQGFAWLLFDKSLPVLEINQNRQELERLSGSSFLGHLARAFSKDLFKLLPEYVGSYLPLAEKLFVALSKGTSPTAAQKQALAKKIADLASRSGQKDMTNRALVRAYAEVTQQTLTEDAKIQLIRQIRKMTLKEKIKNITFSPEQIIEMMAPYIPGFNEGLKASFVAELQRFIHQSPARYQQATAALQPYVEGLLVRMFIRLAEKNPAQEAQKLGEKNKDTMIVITEKLLQKMGEKYSSPQAQGSQDSHVFAKDLSEAMMKEVLGIDSPEFFDDLAPLQGFVYHFVKNQLEGNFVDIRKGLETLETTPETTTAKRPIDQVAEKVAEDVARFILDATVANLAKENQNGDLQLVETISQTIEARIEVAKGQLDVAKVLQDYQEAPQLKQILGKTIKPLLDPQQFIQDRAKVTELLSNLLNRLLSGAIGTIGKFEEANKAKFNQSLMGQLLKVAAEHFKNIREAKELAKQAGRTEIKHKDFHQVARNFEQTLKMVQRALAPFSLTEKGKNAARLILIDVLQEEIKEEEALLQKIARALSQINPEDNILLVEEQDVFEKLKTVKAEDGSSLLEVMKKEALPNLREASGYTPAVKAILRLLLPNGKQDLDFIPESQRSMVWGLLKTNLFPMILQMVTETVLNPDMINTIALNSLQATVETLQAPVDPSPKTAPPLNKELNQAAGELLEQILPMMTLPQMLKDKLLDSNGHVYPWMKETVGSVLMGQLTDHFIQDKLKWALEMAILKQAFNYQAKPATKVTEADLKKASKDVVDAGISYQIRQFWVQAQAKFDKWIADYFGKVGTGVKKALDAVFHFIFFKVIGTILEYAFYPVKLLLKEAIYKVIHLDQNREALLEPLTKKPTDQPKAEHVVYNEDLVSKLWKALEEVLEKTKAPATPT